MYLRTDCELVAVVYHKEKGPCSADNAAKAKYRGINRVRQYISIDPP